MVNIMDMTTGEGFTDAERYGDEVLNANWLPQPGLALGLQPVTTGHARTVAPSAPTDIDGFMSRLYSAQE